MSLRMLSPWKNPRSKFYWFRRRVPQRYIRFGMPSEIKFSLETENWDEAVLRCTEKNIALEREWHLILIGIPPTELSQRQIAALAGEFYHQTVAANQDEPGRPIEWQEWLAKLARRKRPVVGPLGQHLAVAFGGEARTWLQTRDVNLVGDRFELFVRAYVDAKEHATQTLMRNALLEKDLSPITVKDGYIASAKTFFGWAKRAKKIPTNPSADVVVEINEKKHAAKMRGFTDEEAATILSATLAPMSKRMTHENAAARRWVLWLCAYTGARVNEVTQLRACDVKTIQELPCIRITPEAGSVKTSTERTVPLHPHIAEGFVGFAKSKSGETPLFYSIERQRKPDRKNPTYKSVGNKFAGWVRSLGIKDPKVVPNHGWRYRFKNVGLESGMKEVLLDVIQGHAPRTEGEKYINASPKTLFAEILKHPRYEVEPANRRDGRQRAKKG